MAITNHERVGKSLDLLKEGLGPFVQREVQGSIESGRQDAHKLRRYAEDPLLANKPIPEWDVAGLLRLMWETWNNVFCRPTVRCRRRNYAPPPAAEATPAARRDSNCGITRSTKSSRERRVRAGSRP